MKDNRSVLRAFSKSPSTCSVPPGRLLIPGLLLVNLVTELQQNTKCNIPQSLADWSILLTTISQTSGPSCVFAIPRSAWGLPKSCTFPLLPWRSTFLPESSTWSAQLLCSIRNTNFKESHKNTTTVYRIKGGLQVSSWAHRFIFLGAIPVIRGRRAKPWADMSSPFPLCVTGTLQSKRCLIHRTVPFDPHSPFTTCTEAPQ